MSWTIIQVQNKYADIAKSLWKKPFLTFLVTFFIIFMIHWLGNVTQSGTLSCLTDLVRTMTNLVHFRLKPGTQLKIPTATLPTRIPRHGVARDPSRRPGPRLTMCTTVPTPRISGILVSCGLSGYLLSIVECQRGPIPFPAHGYR